tara:strand:+ start:26 stop:340 length:315 start_codon:yes stop_codon:yes gene_type:complete
MSKSTLSKELNKVIEKTITAYINAVSEKYQLESNELQTLWNEVQGSKKQNKPRKSGYINFCKVKRPELKKKNPNMSFGDQGKELGKMWKELSENEQKDWLESNF